MVAICTFCGGEIEGDGFGSSNPFYGPQTPMCEDCMDRLDGCDEGEDEADGYPGEDIYGLGL